MNLVIDVGNTRTKISIFDNSSEIYSGTYSEFLTADAENLKQEFHPIHRAILSSTGKSEESLIQGLPILFKYFLEFNSSTPLPFTSDYKTLETIGLDRLAAIAGAQFLYPKKNILIIDAGTAITYDFLSSTGNHKGGNISPGMKIRFKALNTFTYRLPLIEQTELSLSEMGDSTQQAILNGVITGILHEIEGYIRHFSSFYKDLTILLTGGDAEFFAIKLKNSIFVVHNLVQTGLNIILKYNVEKT
jgi:type III pantothenate kinase